MFKVLIIVLFLAIVFALFASLWSLMRSPAGSPKTANRLMWRVVLSISLLALLVYGFTSGELHVHAPWMSSGLGISEHVNEQK